VSWNALSNIPEVTGYRVYYSQIVSRKRQAGELSVDIADRSQNSVVIDDLETAVQYQFQVVTIVMLGGMEFVSNRSLVDETTMLALTTAPTTSAPTTSAPTTSALTTSAPATSPPGCEGIQSVHQPIRMN
jgi:hypothetical protein